MKLKALSCVDPATVVMYTVIPVVDGFSSSDFPKPVPCNDEPTDGLSENASAHEIV